MDASSHEQEAQAMVANYTTHATKHTFPMLLNLKLVTGFVHVTHY
jgi:hypothetical protein